MANALSEFVQYLVGAISDVATGVANGVSTMAQKLFLAVDAQGAVTGLSTFGGILALFCGISLAIGITTRVYLWITSLGKN